MYKRQAWDCSHREDWADQETGLSHEFWGRSIGWVPVAILDELDFMEPSHPQYEKLCALVRNLLESVCRYQSADGRWYLSLIHIYKRQIVRMVYA